MVGEDEGQRRQGEDDSPSGQKVASWVERPTGTGSSEIHRTRTLSGAGEVKVVVEVLG